MDVLGPFPELDDHEYRVIQLSNGIRVLLISSEKKDTVLRRATSHMDMDDRRAITKLLRDPSITTAIKETQKQRRSTLLTEAGGSTRNLLRKSQRDLNSRRSGIDLSEDPNAISPLRNRISQRLIGEIDPQPRSFRTSQKFTDDSAEAKRTSRRLEGNLAPEDDADDRTSIRSYPSHKSLPGNSSFRKHKSQRLSSTVSLALQPSVRQQSRPAGDSSLLITDMAAVAVCVSVGSLSDPADCQGLAHVVEHMVFMGNEKHPSENDWDTFISSAGGDSNATTEAERTTFHFSVPQESFEASLARFSQFFHKPLLRKESLQRELAAIDSEFNDSAGEVSFRLAEVACATAREGPFSQFACGNSKTLKANPKLHDYVIEFFQAHYVAKNIYVVMYASDSLSDMEELARRHFQTIPVSREEERSSSLIKFNPIHPPFCFPDQSLEDTPPGVGGNCLGCIVVCDPEGSQPHTLQLSWQLSSQRANWKAKPLMYLSHAIGSETEGSILSELKSRGWANALFASDGTYASGLEGNAMSTLFSIYVLLTDQGLLHWDSVVSTVYEYIGMLNREGVQFWFYEELRKCQHAKYLLKRASDPGAMVETLSQRLCIEVSQIPLERVCNGEDLLFEWDPEAISSVLKMLSPETCRIDLITRASDLSTVERTRMPVSGSEAVEGKASSQTVTSNRDEPSFAVADVWLARRIKKRIFDILLKGVEVKIEPWYQTRYCALACPKKMLIKWKSAMQSSSSRTYARLPKRNEYISEEFLLQPKPVVLPTNSPHLANNGDHEVVEFQSRPARVEARCDADFVLISTSQGSSIGDRIWVRANQLQTASMVASVSPQFRGVGRESSSEAKSEQHQSDKEQDVLGELNAIIDSSPFSPSVSNTPALLLPFHSSSTSSTGSGVYLWHLQSGAFSTCRMSLSLLFKFANPPASPLNAVLLDLFLVCFEDAIADEKYPAFLSGTVLEMTAEEKGVRMTFSGFPHTVKLLMERTLPPFLTCAVSGLRHLKNLSLDSQVEVVSTRLMNDDCSVRETLDGVLRLDAHHPLTKLAALDQTQNIRSRLDTFVKAALGNCMVVGLAYGNISIQDTISMRDRIIQFMASTANANILELGDFFTPKRVLNIPPQRQREGQRDSASLMGTTSVFIAPVPSSSVLVYFQIMVDAHNPQQTQQPGGPLRGFPVWLEQSQDAMKDLRLMTQLMAQLLKEPLFNTLRTKWQIVYHAHASVHRCETSYGISIELSSHHTGTVDLVEIIDEFLLLFLDSVLKPMTQLDFNRHVRALQLRKLEKDAGPSEEAERHFDTIIRGLETSQFDWNADVQETPRLQSITKSGMLEFFQSYLHPSSAARRKLSLLIVGESEMLQSSQNNAVGGNTRSVRYRGGASSHRSLGHVVSEEGESEEDEEETKISTPGTTTIPKQEKTSSREDEVSVIAAMRTDEDPVKRKGWWPSQLLRKLAATTKT